MVSEINQINAAVRNTRVVVNLQSKQFKYILLVKLDLRNYGFGAKSVNGEVRWGVVVVCQGSGWK